RFTARSGPSVHGLGPSMGHDSRARAQERRRYATNAGASKSVQMPASSANCAGFSTSRWIARLMTCCGAAMMPDGGSPPVGATVGGVPASVSGAGATAATGRTVLISRVGGTYLLRTCGVGVVACGTGTGCGICDCSGCAVAIGEGDGVGEDDGERSGRSG